MTFRILHSGAAVIVSCLLGVMALVSAARADAFDDWVAALWPDAESLGVSRPTFDAAFNGIRPNFKLPDLDLPSRGAKKKSRKGQPEFIQPPRHYLRERTLVTLAKSGRVLRTRWEDPLVRIKGRFGVEPGIVLAIWGRETAFGGYKLPHDVIQALATQAYTGRRKDKFRGELLLALKILEEGHASRAEMRGSWAGAMGLTQLMPSNFYDHAVDFDGDGRKNIWTSVPDALASAAKSLADNGWTPGRTWGYEVRKPKEMDCTLEGPQQKRSMQTWADLGFTRAFARRWSADQLEDDGYLLLPEGTRGPAFLMHNNFLVIKSYNFADLYALFVGNLADRIAGGGPFETPWATNRQLAKKQIAEIQDMLNKAGFSAGKVDGRAGTITRNAIGAYQKANRLTLDCYPSQTIRKHLSSAQ